jgi:hypothetical protein
VAMDNQTVVVLSDAEGNYYTITRELIELARVGSDQHKARIKELITEQDTGGHNLLQVGTFNVTGSFLSRKDAFLRENYFGPLVNRSVPGPPQPS